ncbi:MAG: hypothetical protein QM764_17425 [Chitinophagaceae bacterium]
MKQVIFTAMVLMAATTAFPQTKFRKNELSINGFRNPSIGLEYHRYQFSVHAGYYTTAFKSGEYTNFLKTGITYWFLQVDKKDIPSSFYAGASYLYGLNRNYKNESAFGIESGFRWMIWKGLNARIGVIAIAAKGKDIKVNPTPGISYSFKF